MWVALEIAIVFIAGNGMAPVRRIVPVGIGWYEVSSFELLKYETVTVRVAIISGLQTAHTASLSQERIALL
jgi:hypothetical protein